MDSHNNTGYTSLKIFCESRMASVHLSNTRKIWTLNKPIVIPTGNDIQMLCSVESASIPLSYYTINETNCKLSFSLQDNSVNNRSKSVNGFVGVIFSYCPRPSMCKKPCQV